MAKRFALKKIFILMSTAGLISIAQQAFAAAFQLWEQDAASIGNYHAGYVSEAADASTSFYNPAGLVRIKNQQLIAGAAPVVTDIKYSGTVAVTTLLTPPQQVVAQGGGFGLIPFAHYAAPISNNLVFGFSTVVPFGLQTNYGNSTNLRYAATLSSVNVIDLSPAVGFMLGDKLSLGVGFDAEKIRGEFNQYATSLDPANDTESVNSGSSWGYGYHFGALFQATPTTRFGFSYHSQVVQHLRGTSKFIGPMANGFAGDPNGYQKSNNLRANTTLPPTTSVSMFHAVNPRWDVMGSITYTQWSLFKQLVLQNVAGMSGDFQAINNLQITVYENYRNSWNYSIGSNYHVNEQFMLRTGLGFDETPSSNRFRNVQLPDSDRIAVALGAHYQATHTLGFDAGWTHVFAMNTRINNLSQPVGVETVTTNGTARTSADVFGLQIKWDIV